MSMDMLGSSAPHPIWSAVVDILGLTYFLAWSISFYPQLLLNYRRKRTDGLSPDFAYLNPLGFIALSTWNGGMIFSSLARSQYAARHDGHPPQVSWADLGFSAHAAVISTITLGQVWYYRRRTLQETTDGEDERQPLISTSPENVKTALVGTKDPAIPSLPCQFALVGILLSAGISAFFVSNGKMEWLDWLYFVSAIKLFISAVKYVPQIILNWRLGAVEGLAIWQIILDMTGSVLSFAQLVISSIFIAHDPSGIIANPAKLGLSGLSASFDIIILSQKYIFFRDKHEGGVEESEERG